MDTCAYLDRCVAALKTGDFVSIGAMVHDDLVINEAEGLPYSGSYRGIEGWKALSRAVVKTWSDFQFDVIEFHGSLENTLFVRFRLSGSSRRTGRPFETTVLEMWRFRDGLLAEIAPYYWDTAQLAAIDMP